MNVPVIDAVEVYAMSKSAFGWNARVAELTERYKITTPTPVGRRSQAEDASQSPLPHTTLLRTLESSLHQLATFHAPA